MRSMVEGATRQIAVGIQARQPILPRETGEGDHAQHGGGGACDGARF